MTLDQRLQQQKASASGGLTLPKPASLPEVCYPAQILHNLYLGDVKHASTESLLLSTLRITHVVDAANDGIAGELRRKLFQAHGVQYCLVEIEDDEKAPLGSHLRRVLRFIDEARAQPDGAVFVHCRQGISRSVSLVLYYLMAAPSVSYPLAVGFKHTKALRPEANPNEHFRRVLVRAERKVLGKNSVDCSLVDPPARADGRLAALLDVRRWRHRIAATLGSAAAGAAAAGGRRRPQKRTSVDVRVDC